VVIVEEDVEAIKKAKEKIWQKFAKDNKALLQKHFSGFRPQNVPRSLAENKPNFLDLQELYTPLLNDILDRGIKEDLTLNVVGLNTVDADGLRGDNPIIVTVNAEVAPTVELGEYEGIKVQYTPIEVEDKEIEAVIQRMRETYAEEIEITDRAVQNSDIAHIEFDGIVDGQPFEGGSTKKPDGTYAVFPLTIGSGQFIQGFEEQLIGMKIDEKKEVTVKFPENYLKKELASKDAIFTVTLRKIAEQKLSEVNDAFAQKIGYNNLIDARNKIKDDLISNKKQQNEALIDDKIFNELLITSTVTPIPELLMQDLLAKELQKVCQQTGMDEKAFFQKSRLTRKAFNDQHEGLVSRESKVRYILDAITEKEKIETTEEQLDAELAMQASGRNVPVDEIKANVGLVAAIKKNLALKLTLEFLKEKATIEAITEKEEVKVTEVEL